ncbi:MAG: hypothetical protein AAFN13_03425 [Bacteroidota bacterium]
MRRLLWRCVLGLVLLVVRGGVPAKAQPLEQKVINYVRGTWEVTSLTDEILYQRLAGAYQDIPFRHYVDYALETADAFERFLACERRRSASFEAAGCYVELANVGLQPVAAVFRDYALSQTGLSGVAATAELGSWFIQRQLYAFFDAVEERALDTQVQLYVEARRCGLSEQQILRADVVLPLPGRCRTIAKLGDWLYVNSWNSPQNPVRYGSSYGAREVFEYAEVVYQAGQGVPRVDQELREVGEAFARYVSTVTEQRFIVASAALPQRKPDGRRWDGGFGEMPKPDPLVQVYVNDAVVCQTTAVLSNVFELFWGQPCVLGVGDGDTIRVVLYDFDPAESDYVGAWRGTWSDLVRTRGNLEVARGATVKLLEL